MYKLILFSLLVNISFARNFDSAINLARHMLDKSLEKDTLVELGLYEQFLTLKVAFENDFKISVIKQKNCYASVYKKDYYQAQLASRKVNKINICKEAIDSSDEIMAQNLIHEVSHAVLLSTENNAIKFELLAAHLSGQTPLSNGNIKPILGESYKALSKEELHFLDYDWKIKMGLIGLDEWYIFALQSYAAMNDVESLKKIVELKKFDHIDRKNIFDQYGNSPLMIAAREGIIENVKYLIAMGFNQNGALKEANKYKRRNIIKLLNKSI